MRENITKAREEYLQRIREIIKRIDDDTTLSSGQIRQLLHEAIDELPA